MDQHAIITYMALGASLATIGCLFLYMNVHQPLHEWIESQNEQYRHELRDEGAALATKRTQHRLVPSGLYAVTNGMRSPIYKPFATFDVDRTATVTGINIVNEAGELKGFTPIKHEIGLVCGDEFNVSFNVSPDHLSLAP